MATGFIEQDIEEIMAKGKKLFEYRAGNTLPYGVKKVTGGVQFAVHFRTYINLFLTLSVKKCKKPV